MEKFSLEKWLQDKSRKVITRDGREVRILDYNLKGDKRICIAVDDKIQESITTVDEDGHCLRDKTGWHESNFDLFFADEEEELTEFEKELQRIISVASHWTSDDGSISTYCQFGDKEIKKISVQILDLARKELEATGWRDSMRKYKEAYEQGKEDALKDLPKWKKMPNGVQGNGDFKPTYLVRTSNGYYFTTPCISWDEDNMYIELSELDKLPKEE